ncbi:ferrichrome ABC transporter permease [Paenibacillus sambharensis]|uniref:Ferrichrome ABC transporter permease n=1 Tax=Paenibacillus sambharensis TaxID=1803190 RepID=A0A2W1LQD8_9BACL|nr:iron ABC transporter permease [Paenibacillus sambharensis]PZD93617.1 ferrichrome ABC transporter permease [Paenibacillus sambharensis]
MNDLSLRFGRKVPAILLIAAPPAAAAIIVLSVLYGAKNIDTATIWNALFQFDPDNVNHHIIRYSRIPRVLGALLIGAFLAVSGALMQGMTRNDLASPSIMGVSDGSAFMITLAMIVLPGATSLSMIFMSLVGSAAGVAIVLGLASTVPGGMSPVRMTIVGAVVSTFLSSISSALAVYFQLSQSVSFWYNARLHQLEPDMIRLALPFAVVGLLLAFLVSRHVTILSLGEEVSAGLGQRSALVKVISTLSIVILTGISVAIAGKIGFIGLIIPHIARFLVGLDYRWVVPCAAVIGAVFLALADLLSRFMNAPFETPIGIVTSLIGVPFFLYLIRKRGGGERD